MDSTSCFASRNDDDCIHCGLLVRARQEAITCDECERWQHRTCDTGITRNKYRRVVKGFDTIQWVCHECRSMQLEPRTSECRNKRPSSCMTNEPDIQSRAIPFKKRKFSGEIQITSARLSLLTLSPGSTADNSSSRWSLSSGETTLDSESMERFWNKEMSAMGIQPLPPSPDLPGQGQNHSEMEVEERTFVFDELDSSEEEIEFFRMREKRFLSILDYDRRLAEAKSNEIVRFTEEDAVNQMNYE